MVDLLIKLVCYEYEVEENMLFSSTRVGYIVEPLSLIAYILHTENDMNAADIQREFSKRGSKKKRAGVYYQIRKGFDLVNNDSSKYRTYKFILDSLRDAKDEKVYVETDTSFHTTLGRILQKIYNVKSLRHLNSIESTVESFLQTEFLHVGDFKEEAQ